MVAPVGALPPDATLVAEVIGLIERTEPPAHRDMLRTFATLYLKRLPESDVPDLEPGELLAEIEDLLAFVSASPPPEPHVRVVVPDADEVGYTTIGSVIQVVAPDGPFLVDSVTAAVTNAGAGIVRHLHPVIGTERSHDGALVAVSAARMSAHRESVQHFEVDRRFDADAATALEESIRSVLRDVHAAVDDFDPMRRAVARMAEAAKASVHNYGYEEIAEAVAFLEWLLDDNYVFLGYRDYEIDDGPEGPHVHAVADSGLGILRGNGSEPSSILLADLPLHLQERYSGGSLMVIAKTNRNATVHRDARMDYVGLRRLDDAGRMVAELRLLGLFTEFSS